MPDVVTTSKTFEDMIEALENNNVSITIPKIKDMTTEDAVTTRHNLLKYCELDTYAMVKVWEKLKTAIGE